MDVVTGEKRPYIRAYHRYTIVLITINNMLIDDLSDLDLSPEEAKVYLAILELGGGYVSIIAKKARVNRATCYNTLGNLVQKGLAHFALRQGVRFYLPEPPQVLTNQFEEKYETARRLLPQLNLLHGSSAFTPKLRYYEEKDAVSGLFDDIANSSTEILGYTNLAPLSEILPAALRKFATNLVARNLRARLLTPFDPNNEAIITGFFAQPIALRHLEILCVNKDQFAFRSGTFFYDDKVTIISYDKQELLGVVIESAVNAETQKAIFDLAWLGATSFIVQ